MQREAKKKKKAVKKTVKDKRMALKSIENLPDRGNSPISKKAKVPPGDENIDSNVSCACFGNYDDDVLEGSGATCGRWLHNYCVEECKEDDEGNDHMCVDVLTTYQSV